MTKSEIRINDEARMTKKPFVICHSLLIRHSGFVILISSALAAAGCSSDKQPSTRPSSVADRQKAALHDPFGLERPVHWRAAFPRRSAAMPAL